MKVNRAWLDSWVATGLDASAMADCLTQAGLEVDSVTPVADSLDGVVVAQVMAVAPHPDADRLRVCEVSTGEGENVTIVCGAPNVQAGMKAPLATPGAVLPNGLKIKPSKLRGVRSEGMLCSAVELGLGADSGGLLALPAHLPLGQPLLEALELDDQVFELDLTPNRADCLSVRGLARELSALTGAAVTAPELMPVVPTTQCIQPVQVEATEACPVYLSRVIEAVNAQAASPLWLTERLRRCGLRSLGPVVDVTNYVLLELGQPLHAFDLQHIDGALRIRYAKSGERLTLLDEREVALEPDMLVIADQRQALALAGVMGGLASAVTEHTRDIVLEVAWFDPRAVAGRARRLGLATESAHRFERGVDPELQRSAMERATALIVEIAGGRAGPITEVRHDHHALVPRELILRPERANQLLGTSLSASEMADILKALHMGVRSEADTALHVSVPSARRDLNEEVDLIEELARRVGYDQLPTALPSGQLSAPNLPEAMLSERSLRQQLVARGWHEVMTWSFVGHAQLVQLGLGEGAWPLANPLSQDMAYLRTSLLPGMLATIARNQRQSEFNLRLMELGTVFVNRNEQLEERRCLGLAMTGARTAEHFDAQPQALDVYDLKGEIEALLSRNQLPELECLTESAPAWLHPGQGAYLQVAGEICGWMGQLHPALLASMDVQGPLMVAELQLAKLGLRRLPKHSSASKFPSVRRDLSLLVPESVTAASVLDCAKAAAGSSLQKTVIFDLYRGQGVEKGWKSVGLGLIFREVSRTLTDDEVDVAVQAVLSALQQSHQIGLRG